MMFRDDSMGIIERIMDKLREWAERLIEVLGGSAQQEPVPIPIPVHQPRRR